jgi:hypothetical protein
MDDSGGDGLIKLIDDMELNRYFDKTVCLRLHEELARIRSTYSYFEKVELIEKIYLDIRTWVYKNPNVYLTLKEKIGMLISFIKRAVLGVDDSVNCMNTYFNKVQSITLHDSCNTSISTITNEGINILDRVRIKTEGATYDNDMSLLHPNDVDRIILGDRDGDSMDGPYITKYIDGNDFNKIATEKAVTEYTERVSITKDDIKTSDTIARNVDDASEEKVVSEKALYDILRLNILGNE